MSYLDEREQDEAVSPPAQNEVQPKVLNLGALSKKTPKTPEISAEAQAVAVERGFGRELFGTSDQVEQRIKKKGAGEGPAADGEKAKPRRQISRRPRNSGRDTGQLTLTGDASTLQELIELSVYNRVPYVAMLGQLLKLWEETHGAVPEDFSV